MYYSPPTALAPVLVSFAGPRPQSRGSVLVRIVLVIPHLIVLYLLGIAVEVVAFLGWWGALFTGRLPAFAAQFLTGYLRWLTRVFAYTCLLTDVYPPFTFDDAAYPVRVTVLPGSLNRLAVLFRLILAFPAMLLQMLVTYGAFTIVAIASWLIVLVRGSMPESLHLALAAALRFQTRFFGYLLMLTSAYPGGLFGDRPADPATFEGAWSLVLTSAARRLLGAFLVIGLVVVASQGVSDVHDISNFRSLVGYTRAQVVMFRLNVTVSVDTNAIQACGGDVTCITGEQASLAGAYSTFANDIVAVPMPAGKASAETMTVAADAQRLASDASQLSKATTLTQYSSLMASLGVNAESSQLNRDYGDLRSTLTGSFTPWNPGRWFSA
ncbi:MAG TPA: DUF4389 domain-containing protein [Streptosporangiaceae bacterium]|nr:DUF4389 domain-containing protein [Streptosporangiaceae bacterium]